MSFNPTKCAVVRIARERNPINDTYNIHNHDLAVVKRGKYLGFTVADNLSKKVNKTLAFLWRNVSRFSGEREQGPVLHFSRPTFEYAATAWDPYDARNIQQLETVQRRAARFVTGTCKTTKSTSQMIASLDKA